MNPELSTADLELVYDALADAIDRAGDGRGMQFLTQLALLLARQAGDRAAVLAAIDDALQAL